MENDSTEMASNVAPERLPLSDSPSSHGSHQHGTMAIGDISQTLRHSHRPTVTPSLQPTLDTSMMVGIAVGGAALAVIVFGLIGYFYRRRAFIRARRRHEEMNMHLVHIPYTRAMATQYPQVLRPSEEGLGRQWVGSLLDSDYGTLLIEEGTLQDDALHVNAPSGSREDGIKMYSISKTHVFMNEREKDGGNKNTATTPPPAYCA